MGAKGDVVEPLDEKQLKKDIKVLKEEGVEAITVSLINAYANGAHERRVREIVEKAIPGVPVSISSEVIPEMYEYERTETTVANSYVRPVVSKYMQNLEKELKAKMGSVKVSVRLGLAAGLAGFFTGGMWSGRRSSLRSSSRMISSIPLLARSSRVARRSSRYVLTNVLMSLGRRCGPTAMSSTIPITTHSVPPMPNMCLARPLCSMEPGRDRAQGLRATILRWPLGAG